MWLRGRGKTNSRVAIDKVSDKKEGQRGKESHVSMIHHSFEQLDYTLCPEVLFSSFHLVAYSCHMVIGIL